MFKKSFEVKPSDPLLTTRWFDVACAALWLTYGLWALVAVIQQIPVFHQVGAPHWYGLIWAGLLGASSLIAAVGASLIFFQLPRMAQVVKKRIERDALGVFSTLIFVLHAVLVWSVVIGGHVNYLASCFVVFSYYIIPLFRMYHLNRRIKALSGYSV